MSRGPGRVERLIASTFTANPSMTYTVDDLAALAYPGLNRIEKKHRVAAMRAAKKVAARAWWTWRGAERPGHPTIYFNLLDHRSYVVGRMWAHQNFWGASQSEINAAIDDPNVERPGAAQWREEAQPGGAYWIHVEINRAEHAGDHDRAEVLKTELNATVNRQLAMLGAPRS